MSEARVLVVDDEKSMRDLLAITLQKAGYEVTLAEGGAAAVEAIRRESFDAIITDLRMPKVDGLQVLRSAKELSPDTAVGPSKSQNRPLSVPFPSARLTQDRPP